jgi:excisionase family DNA binding protein
MIKERERENIEHLWTVRDVAGFLRVTESAVRAWILSRRIRFYRIGSRVRFFPEEIIDDAHQGKIGQFVPSDNRLKNNIVRYGLP